MPTPKVKIWSEAPELAIPDLPSILSDEDQLLLAYKAVQGHTVIKFEGVIDYHLSPINDEGLGEHPLSRFGLRAYFFHEILDSEETRKWAALKARHWVVTFKDVTLNILAGNAAIETPDLISASPLDSLLLYLSSQKKTG